MFREPQYFKGTTDDDADTAVTTIDFEEQSAGYQVAFSRLASSETVEPDPVGYVGDPVQYLQDGLNALRGRIGQQVDMLIAGAGSSEKDQ